MAGRRSWLVLLVLVAAVAWFVEPESPTDPSATTALESAQATFLPSEAQAVIGRILREATHPYPQDGTTFFNREQRLPQRPRGYYREYTVDTPGLHHRGARRIVTGGHPPEVWFYTDDHYDSFRPFEVQP